MGIQISLPSNCYLIQHKQYLVGLKYFDYDTKDNSLYDRDSSTQFKYMFKKIYLDINDPYLLVSNILIDIKFEYYIDIKTKIGSEILKIERNEKDGIFIGPFDDHIQEIPFLLDVNVTKIYVIRIPVLFEIDDIIKIINDNIIVKKFIIPPPDEIYNIQLQNNIKFNFDLYKKIYNILLNIETNV